MEIKNSLLKSIPSPAFLPTNLDSPVLENIGIVAKQFSWVADSIQPDNYGFQFEQFSQRYPDFSLSSRQLVIMVEDVFGLTDTIYQQLFPESSCPLPYHDIVHTKITGITALKLFLGFLVANQPVLESLVETNQLELAVHTFFSTACLHEFNDWLVLPRVANPHDIELAKQTARNWFSQRSISLLDFDKILSSDDYGLSPEQSLQQAHKLTPGSEKSFLAQDQTATPSVFDNIALLQVAQSCLITADFLQVANPAYSEEHQLVDNLGQTHKFSLALLALFWEMAMFRPKGIDGSKWRNKDGQTVNINSLRPNSYYLENIALGRIQTGINYLQYFNQKEYLDTLKVLDKVRLSALQSN